VGGEVLRATALARSFAGSPVLAGVDLAVGPGEVLALLGPNGAGKTTLLRVLGLLLRASGGRLELFGTDAASAAPALRRRIGYVGHESWCYADLTAAENLAFHARLHGVQDAPARTAELLAWSGLADVAGRRVRAFSRGMTQRLSLARSLLHRPDLLLLDEPWSGLDRTGTRALDERLALLAAAGHTIVVATHDLDRAVPLATRLAVLHRGRIAWTHEGRTSETVAAAAYESVTGAR
jgi:heme exporter protein A